jgi:hypothetical protein
MIRWVVALESEARPLAARFGLNARDGGDPFPVFRGEDGSLLIVTGAGKLAAAAAVGYLYAVGGSERDVVWLNVGLAGHRDLEIGHGSLAHKVIDRGSGETWYPPIVVGASCPSATVMTVERRERDFGGPWLYDLEAAGFFAAATQFSGAELVHGFKVVADTPEAVVVDQPSARFTEELIESQLDSLEEVGSRLAELADELRTADVEPTDLERFRGRWIFTPTEERLLRRLLRRWTVLAPEVSPWDPEMEVLGGADDVLRHVRSRLDALALAVG